MKITPVSGDLVVKVALGAAVIGALYYIVQAAQGKAASAINDAAAWAANIASTKLNPASDQNVVYAPITSAVTALAGRDESIGTLAGGYFSGGDQAVANMLAGKSNAVTAPATAQDAAYQATGLPF